MSKASEWARARPSSCGGFNDDWIGTVLVDGRMSILDSQGRTVVLGPNAAVKIARWILDTFDEPAS